MKISLKRIVLFLITCIFLVVVFVNLNISDLIKTIKNFNYKYIILLSFSAICSLSMRGICYKQLISKTVKAPLKELIPLCITGAALNIVLPARAGDLFRAWYTGSKYNADKVKIFGSVILERIFDGLVILCLLFLGLILYSKNQLALNLFYASAFVFITSLFVCYFAFKFNKTDCICKYIEEKTQILPDFFKKIIIKIIGCINKLCNSFINGFEIFQSPQKLIFVILSVVGIWFFECLCYYITIAGFGIDVNWTVVLFIMGFIALACMIPSTSIFIGPYQVAVISAFSIYNINKETAIAISIVEQAVVTLTVSVIASIFLFKNDISYKDIKQDVMCEKNTL